MKLKQMLLSLVFAAVLAPGFSIAQGRKQLRDLIRRDPVLRENLRTL